MLKWPNCLLSVLASLGLTAGVSIASSTPVHAQLQFCNETDIPIFTAVGEEPNHDKLSTGWYYLKRDQCKNVIKSRLTDNEYWAFGINSEEDYQTDGDEDLCVVQDKAFTKLRRDNCHSEGGREEEFITVNVQGYDQYRVTFTGSRYDTNASIQTSSELYRNADNGPTTTAGRGCTSPVMLCGDPSGSQSELAYGNIPMSIDTLAQIQYGASFVPEHVQVELASIGTDFRF